MIESQPTDLFGIYMPMKNHKLGLPYMGSKRKIAGRIVDKIQADNPNVKYIYDLFGGGGAVSFECLSRWMSVTYNELNTGVVELLKKIRDDGITPEFYQWIDRDTFNAHKNDSNWFGGLCKVVWSFGNSQKSYMFGKNIERFKKIGHELIVDKSETARIELSDYLGFDIDTSVFDAESINDRRLNFGSQVRANKKRFDLQRLEQLERLQRLQQLERLQLDGLAILNQSFDEVEITTPINETVIYLDPPYFNTAKYQEAVCYDALKKYIDESPYKIYLSSYEYDMPVVAEFEHRSTLRATAKNKVIERLYCNQPQ